MKSKDIIPILNELDELISCGIYINDKYKIEEFKKFLKTYYKYKNCNNLPCDYCFFSKVEKIHYYFSQKCLIEKINDRSISLQQTLIKYTEILIKYYKLIGEIND